MIDTGIFSLLSTAPLITAICATRIYPDVRPNAAEYPLIEYKEISSISDPTFETSGMQRDRYQFDCWAQTSLGAKQLRDVLRQTLNGYQGVFLSDETFLQNALLVNRTSYYTDIPRLYCASIEFHLFYTFTN